MVDKNRLKIVSTDINKNQNLFSKKKRIVKSEEIQAKFDRLWLQEPQKFDLSNSIRELKRMARTLVLIKEKKNLMNQIIADLGCGSGFLSRMLRDEGAIVDAVDVSQNALKRLQEHDCQRIHPIHDCLPNTTLNDAYYDIVIAADLIASCEPDQYRLFFSELARIVKLDGYVVCSTPIDIYSENALQRFAELAATEFDHFTWVFSYHYLQIKFLDFFKAPKRFLKASHDKRYREKSLNQRYAFSKWWFKINSRVPLCYFWKLLKPLTDPLCKLFEKNETILLLFERISKFLWDASAISHAIFITQKKPIISTINQRPPKQLKHKKQVWE